MILDTPSNNLPAPTITEGSMPDASGNISVTAG